jgi:hypothetical protein
MEAVTSRSLKMRSYTRNSMAKLLSVHCRGTVITYALSAERSMRVSYLSSASTVCRLTCPDQDI